MFWSIICIVAVKFLWLNLDDFFLFWGSPGSSAGKESTCNAGDSGLIPGSGKSPRKWIGYPFQYSWASPMLSWKIMCLQCRRPGFNPWVGKSPGGEHGNPVWNSCLEHPHGQRSLLGYSPGSLNGNKYLVQVELTIHGIYLQIC